MSPFLFILAMEGFHVALLKYHQANVFRGISISDIHISHLFYADDVVLLSSWDPYNAKRLIHILRCFYLASGLKINLQKSMLIGMGVSYNHVKFIASRLVCAPESLRFFHLGVPVGQNMARVSAWSIIEDRLRSKIVGSESEKSLYWRSSYFD